MLNQGFGDWTRKDFFNFVRSCEAVGSANLGIVARDLGKSEREVERYMKTFMDRYTELSEGERWYKRIKSGDGVNFKRKQMEELLTKKLGTVGNSK